MIRATPTVVIGAVAVLAVALAWVAVRADPGAFRPYFGALPPVLVVAGVAILAVPVLGFLDERGWDLWSDARWGWLLVGAGALVLVVVAIVADLVLRYPEDMNVASPAALTFYPVIALVVEVVLHALPLAVLVALFGSPDSAAEARFWVFAAAIALIEAGLQAAFAESMGTAVFSGVHLAVIGVFQVFLFRRFGFVPMLGFRLVYYAGWHLVWGAVRLRLLF